MNEAQTFAQLGFAFLTKADFKKSAENYGKAVEIGLKIDPTSKQIGDWYYNYCSSSYTSQNYENLKKIGLEYAKYAESVQNYTHLVNAYDTIVSAISSTANYDEGEYEKYKTLQEEAKTKKAEEEELSNPILNSIKAKGVLLAFDPDAKVTKQFTDQDLKEAIKVDGFQLIQDPNFSKEMETFSKKLITSIEVITVKNPNSVYEGKAWTGIATYSLTVAAFLSLDSSLADLAVKCLEKGRMILEKVDRLGIDLQMLLGTGAGFLGSYPAKKDIMEKYQRMQKEITEENTKLLKEKETKMNQKIENLEEAKEDLSQRLSKVEVEQKQLGERFVKLQSSVNLLQDNMSQTTDKLKELANQKENLEDMTLLNSLMEKEKALLGKKATLKKIGDNKDLSEYYNSMMQDLEAIYIGARAASSGKLEVSKSTSYSDAASFASGFIQMIPLMGGILSSAVSGIATIGDAYQNTKDGIGLMKIGEISPNIVIFGAFIEEVVLAYMKKNEAQVVACNGATINEKEWKSMIVSAVTGGVEGMFEKLMKENDSKAKIQGKADSAKVINYLQKGFIVIKPGDQYEKYVQWIMEEKAFKKESQTETTTKPKKKPTSCFCFCKKNGKVNSQK